MLRGSVLGGLEHRFDLKLPWSCLLQAGGCFCLPRRTTAGVRAQAAAVVPLQTAKGGAGQNTQTTKQNTLAKLGPATAPECSSKAFQAAVAPSGGPAHRMLGVLVRVGVSQGRIAGALVPANQGINNTRNASCMSVCHVLQCAGHPVRGSTEV